MHLSLKMKWANQYNIMQYVGTSHNYLLHSISSCDINVHMYVDDTELHYSTKSPRESKESGASTSG